jgi:excisionase family DNA binding protein
VAKKLKDEVFGLSGAANYLGCAESTVRGLADAKRLPHKRDSSGKRLFSLADLEKYKRTRQIGNQGRAAVSA